MLVLYAKILQLQPFDEDYFESNDNPLSFFCQLLTDYLAMGHFNIFEKLAYPVSKANYNKLIQTTLLMVHFCQTHEEQKDNKVTYLSQMSMLGEQLAIRFELEDELIYNSNLLDKKLH